MLVRDDERTGLVRPDDSRLTPAVHLDPVLAEGPRGHDVDEAIHEVAHGPEGAGVQYDCLPHVSWWP